MFSFVCLVSTEIFRQDGLKRRPEEIGGQVYFITNDDARPFWGFLGDILQGLG